MKKAFSALFGMALCLASAAFAGDGNSAAPGKRLMKGNNGRETKVRIFFDGREAVVALFDTPASRDFASLLPITLTFKDYAATEKIAYLPRKLAAQSGTSGGGAQGDFAYYAPWGNLAVFYKGFGGGDNGLYILGRIESGKETLAGMTRDFAARMELTE